MHTRMPMPTCPHAHAQDLAVIDAPEWGKTVGSSDPYVDVHLEGSYYRTSTIEKTCRREGKPPPRGRSATRPLWARAPARPPPAIPAPPRHATRLTARRALTSLAGAALHIV